MAKYRYKLRHVDNTGREISRHSDVSGIPPRSFGNPQRFISSTVPVSRGDYLDIAFEVPVIPGIITENRRCRVRDIGFEKKIIGGFWGERVPVYYSVLDIQVEESEKL